MHISRLARASAGLAGAVGLSVLAPLGVSGASAEVDSPPVLEQTIVAEQALELAQEVMAGASTELSPSLALRELALRQSDLAGADQRAAEVLLTRPNGGAKGRDLQAAVWSGAEAPKSVSGGGCSSTVPVCVHWTNQGDDAPPSADTNSNQVPDWVEVSVTEMETVWNYEINTLGYRAPLTDERASIDNDGVNFDVYLSDIGSRGYYGYCTVDDSRTKTGYQYGDFSTYCVLDNDFARDEFPTNSPRENLQVTAAHEFFHAVQYAYDAMEDGWFLEGSAAWIEDEVYDSVNDNRQYLIAASSEGPPFRSMPLAASASTERGDSCATCPRASAPMSSGKPGSAPTTHRVAPTTTRSRPSIASSARRPASTRSWATSGWSSTNPEPFSAKDGPSLPPRWTVSSSTALAPQPGGSRTRSTTCPTRRSKYDQDARWRRIRVSR